MKAEVLSTIRKNYSYHGVYESEDKTTLEMNLSIVRNPHEIIFRLKIDDKLYGFNIMRRLETNAFVIEDDDKEYFFITEDTSKDAYDSISLKKIKDIL